MCSNLSMVDNLDWRLIVTVLCFFFFYWFGFQLLILPSELYISFSFAVLMKWVAMSSVHLILHSLCILSFIVLILILFAFLFAGQDISVI